ncbi:hypothetical protein HY439_03375 [Candidatus Microgenomates bacterium]|nr:hypothetical protein [Candidatus Microgenomates bacterium]
METENRLVLIDGHAILHRAFHALPPLTNSRGEQSGAVFGFCSMLLRIVQDLKPKYLAVTFDLPAPTFRQKLYSDYQSQRPQMADELSSQIGTLQQVLQEMEIPIFEMAGFEADDLIGTLSKKVKNQVEVIIVTGDRDMLQLVNNHVKLLAPVKGITQMILYDESQVKEKYGLKPKQWVDFKALVGDPSDNYPGVSGIGPKTACDLLQKYESIENLYKNLDKLPAGQAKILSRDEKQVEMAKKLAEIVCNVEVKFNLEDCRLKPFDRPEVIGLFTRLEFKSLIGRLKGEVLPREKLKKANEDNQLKLI